MDTEEDLEIKKSFQKGHPQTDEGPYYHESWWESYKGSVKGKLGGLVIGALIGAVVGVAATAVMSLAGLEVAALAVVAGFSAAGMVYGAHEFSEVGKVTGAVAAAHEKSEERMKSFENGKFAELKREISEIKGMISGKPTVSTPKESESTSVKSHDDYRVKHYQDHNPNEPKKLVFWNVAAIGLAVGAAAGALLATGGFDTAVLEHLGTAGQALEGSAHIATVGALGLFGASFGINRDIFKQVFDKTDLLFRGIVKGGDATQKVRDREHSVDQEKCVTPNGREGGINTVVYESHLQYPQSDTHHRDLVLASGKQVLLSMDHTKARPH